MTLKKILKKMLFDEKIEIYCENEKPALVYIGFAGQCREQYQKDLKHKLIAITRSKEAIRLLIKREEKNS